VAPERENGSSSRSSTDALRIGRIGRPHGNEGAFTISEATERLELLDAGRTVLVAGHEAKVAWRKGTSQRPLVKLEGVDDRAGVEALRGETISVPREEIGTLEQGEYLVDDLIGCEVVDGTEHVGVVGDVLLMPSADLLEVERDAAVNLLVPLVADAVRAIDLEARRVDVDTRFLNEH
jgi:16S rRNA processing protein RimM